MARTASPSKINSIALGGPDHCGRNPGLSQQAAIPLPIQHNNEGLAGIAEQYLTKGAKVLVEGKLVTTKWQDREGNDRYTTEVQVQPFSGLLTFLSSKRQDGERASGGEERAAAPAREPVMAGVGAGDLDEIPF